MSVKLDLNNNSSYQSLEKFIETCPSELIQNIFSYLDDSQLGKCRQVCKLWNEIASDETFLKTRYSEPEEAFGKKKWETFFGKIEDVPHLPREIKKILESPCPIYDGKKIKDTHILFYNPGQVNGQPHTVNNLKTLLPVQIQECGIDHVNIPNDKGEWILMTKDVLSGSSNKSYTEQQTLITNLSQKSQAMYQIPKLIQVITGIFVESVRSGTQLYSKTSTRCQELEFHEWSEKAVPLAVKFRSADDTLEIASCYGSGNFSFIGIGAVRKL